MWSRECRQWVEFIFLSSEFFLSILNSKRCLRTLYNVQLLKDVLDPLLLHKSKKNIVIFSQMCHCKYYIFIPHQHSKTSCFDLEPSVRVQAACGGVGALERGHFIQFTVWIEKLEENIFSIAFWEIHCYFVRCAEETATIGGGTTVACTHKRGELVHICRLPFK